MSFQWLPHARTWKASCKFLSSVGVWSTLPANTKTQPRHHIPLPSPLRPRETRAPSGIERFSIEAPDEELHPFAPAWIKFHSRNTLTLGWRQPFKIATTSSLLRPTHFFSSVSRAFSPPAASSAFQTRRVLSCTFVLLSSRSYSKKKKMPPKKQAEPEKILLGRPGNSLKSGIVSS